MRSASERFWSKVKRGKLPYETLDRAHCWEWTGAHKPSGYSQMYVGLTADNRPVMMLAHRVAYELMRGPIADSLVLDHKCRNRGCVNPFHLEPVTGKENTKRGFESRGKADACRKGHPFNELNTRYRERNGVQERICRTCVRERRQKAGGCVMALDGLLWRKMPVVVTAVQLLPENNDLILQFAEETACPFEIVGDHEIIIHTLEGDMRADKGDYLIQGVKGEFYPCKPDIFEATYEKEGV